MRHRALLFSCKRIWQCHPNANRVACTYPTRTSRPRGIDPPCPRSAPRVGPVMCTCGGFDAGPLPHRCRRARETDTCAEPGEQTGRDLTREVQSSGGIVCRDLVLCQSAIMPQLWSIGLEERPDIAPHSSPTCCALQIHSPRCNIHQQCLPDLIAQFPILYLPAHATETLQDPVICRRPQCTIGKYIESLSSTLVSPDRALFSDCFFMGTSCIPIPVDLR